MFIRKLRLYVHLKADFIYKSLYDIVHPQVFEVRFNASL